MGMLEKDVKNHEGRNTPRVVTVETRMTACLIDL